MECSIHLILYHIAYIYIQYKLFTGYGDYQGILAGNGERISYRDIMKTFKTPEYEELYDIPVAMIVDAINIPNNNQLKPPPRNAGSAKLQSIAVTVLPSSDKGVKFSDIIPNIMKEQYERNCRFRRRRESQHWINYGDLLYECTKKIEASGIQKVALSLHDKRMEKIIYALPARRSRPYKKANS